MDKKYPYVLNSKSHEADARQPFILISVGMTGVGKTYAAIQEIIDYVRDNHETGKAGGKAFVFDTNFEAQYAKMFPLTATKEMVFSIQDKGCRRILPYNDEGDIMDEAEMRMMSTWMASNIKNALVVFDDIDKYYRGAKSRDISKLFMSNRHLGLDVIIQHQSLQPIPTVEWQNVTVIRLHKTVDSVDKISDRVPNAELIKIAELIVEEQFQLAEDLYRHEKIEKEEYVKRRSYFVYVNVRTNRISGAFSIECFRRNAKKYLNINKRLINDYIEMHADDETGEAIYNRKAAITKMIDNFETRYFDGTPQKK